MWAPTPTRPPAHAAIRCCRPDTTPQPPTRAPPARGQYTLGGSAWAVLPGPCRVDQGPVPPMPLTWRQANPRAGAGPAAWARGEQDHVRGWPISRILFQGLRPFGGHSSGRHITAPLVLPTRASRAEASLRMIPHEAPIRHCSWRGLPCRSGCPSRGGLLPHRFTCATGQGPGQSDLCGAFPRVAPAGRYPAPLPHGVRTFLDPRPKTRTAATRPSAPDRSSRSTRPAQSHTS